MPPWLLNYPGMRFHVNDALFLEKVNRFYDWLFPKLLPYQFERAVLFSDASGEW